MGVVFRLWLTLCSLFITATVFLVKESVTLNPLANFLGGGLISSVVASLPDYFSYIAYFFVAVCMTALTLPLTKLLSADQIPAGSIVSIEPANDAFLPSYLGYFFVALSINDWITFVYVFSVVFIFIYFSKLSYFNPIFLLLGYKFFYLVNKSGLKIVVASRSELKLPSEVEFGRLRRINSYTFFSNGGKH